MGRVEVSDEAIGAVVSALRRLESDLEIALTTSTRELRDAVEEVESELRARQRRLDLAGVALARARAELDRCLGAEPPHDCSGPAAAVQAAERALESARDGHRAATEARRQLRSAEQRSSRAAARARARIQAEIPAAITVCRRSMSEVSTYLDGSESPVPVAGTAVRSGPVGSGAPPAPVGTLGPVELVPVASIDSSDGTVGGPGSFEKLSWPDAQWSTDALSAVVSPAVSQGKGRDYFIERDRRESRSAPRSYTAVYDGYFGADTAIKLSQGPDGRLSVTNGYHRIWAARQAGLSQIPARVRR